MSFVIYEAAIARAVELSVALPEEAARLLEDIKRRERERLDTDGLENMRSVNTYSRSAGILASAGIRPPEYKPSPRPKSDARFEPWITFAHFVIKYRQAMKPLRFHQLFPFEPGTEAKMRAISPEIGKILDRRIDNASALKIAADCAGNLSALSGTVPEGWPERVGLCYELALEATTAFELAGRIAFFLGRNKEAVEHYDRATELCRKAGLAERWKACLFKRVRAGLAGGEHAGDLLELLDEPPPVPAWQKYLQPSLASLVGQGLGAAVGEAKTWEEAEAKVLRATLHENLNESDEAQRLIKESASFTEPEPGRIPCPDRNEFLTVMMDAAMRQFKGEDFKEPIGRLNQLVRRRSLALSYCETAANVWARVSKTAAKFYRERGIAIADM
jgi:hypothetical protein